MKIKFFIIACLFFFSEKAQAMQNNVSYGTSFRKDSFSWSLAGPEGNPSTLSQLKWSQIQSKPIVVGISYSPCRYLYIKGKADYGNILSGVNSDSDYLLDHKQGLFSKIVANSGKGEVFALSFGLGCPLLSPQNMWQVAPLIGVSWNEMHLHMYEAKQKVPYKETIIGLDSRYQARYISPWIGVDIHYNLSKKVLFYSSFCSHLAFYKGKGKWNLREDLSRIRHTGQGLGSSFCCRLSYALSSHLGLSIQYNGQDWRVREGVHKVNTDLDGEEVLKLKLNRVDWNSSSISFLLQYLY